MLTLPMAGLSFREYLGMVHGLDFKQLPLAELLATHQTVALRILEAIEQQGHKILALFSTYLEHGYYPYCLEYPDTAQFLTTLIQQVQTTLEADLPAIHPTLNGTSIRKMRRLLSIISGLVPYSPDMKALKGMLDIGDERTLKTYLGYLEDAGILRSVAKSNRGLRAMEKPGKIYLHNPNLYHALSGGSSPDRGSIRETCFLNMLQAGHQVRLAEKGDFVVDETMTFEVGGRNKDGGQIKDVENSWLAIDNIEIGQGHRIPLWMFGFLE
jgi:predicted AAA+ superfamily ATPase